MSSASFHPNPTGQAVIATAMAAALTPAVSLSTARR
jgi:lysophospholipase L1-like esterase